MRRPEIERRHLRPSEIAARHGVSKSFVLTLIRKGELPAKRLGGKVLVVAVEDVDAWINQQPNAAEGAS